MRDRECWDTFYMSGKVADYLSYREAAETAEDRLKTAEAVLGQRAVEKDRTDEAGPYPVQGLKTADRSYQACQTAPLPQIQPDLLSERAHIC